MIVGLYAGLLAMLFMQLTFRVIKRRRQEKVAIGDGGNITLQRAIGVHNNFAQYVPITLLLMTLAELQQAPALLIHALGLVLLISRLIHAHGVGQINENFKLRQRSMVMTVGCIYVASIYLVLQFLYLNFV